MLQKCHKFYKMNKFSIIGIFCYNGSMKNIIITAQQRGWASANLIDVGLDRIYAGRLRITIVKTLSYK